MTERTHTETVKLDRGRTLLVADSHSDAVDAAVEHFIATANDAIDRHEHFTVALSGGSTPKAIYERLCHKDNRDRLDWSSVWLFWSDERCVPPDDPSSNYRMAMDAGISSLPIPSGQIIRMAGERDPAAAAQEYRSLLDDYLVDDSFDLIMLGMGTDGHTASLFPHSEALHVEGVLAACNWVDKLNSWRITLTFTALARAKNVALYILGEDKAEMLSKVLHGDVDREERPLSALADERRDTLWFLDKGSASLL